MERISEIFGSMVFNDSVMMKRMPREAYEALKETIREGRTLDRSVAEITANAMRQWALENGATHFTHWFQPMTGITAEKHEAFIAPAGNGKILLEFSGKELIKGEPDASSFPSGGLRATFEARGYTAWDPTSYAFIKDNTLCIPSVFCSYTGQVLDKKTPLLRSMEAVSAQAVRLLRLFGMKDVNRVEASVGAEQEYFLIDQDMLRRRPDLKLTGRTLFGARPAKGQELADQYFGALKTRVSAFMRDLDEELWKLGILARTEHNEAAPGQHELAPIYTNVNIATDNNQLTMEMMKKVAARHGMVCLLHEKPFDGVNGSGKHNNWSLSTDTGINLLDPGKKPAENLRFLMFLAAVVKAVDEHQDLLRICVATAGNDHRLGGDEAPPAIMSMYLGEEITRLIDTICRNENYEQIRRDNMETGISHIPVFRRDTADRNRTSPFAFTGNKFEFRSVGSSMSIAEPNIMLNTIAAEAFRGFADELEGAEDFETAAWDLLRRTFREHGRILFGGNSYSVQWREEAQRRGLLNFRTAADAIPHLTDEKNISLFEFHGIFTREEVASRRDILLDNYAKVTHIEAMTMLDMVRRDILPAILRYSGELAAASVSKQAIGLPFECERAIIEELASHADSIRELAEDLDEAVSDIPSGSEVSTAAFRCRDSVLPAMRALRDEVDAAELITDAREWPYPSYSEMLFSVE